MKILNKIVNIVLILIIFICIYNISEKLIEYNKADNSYEKIRVEKEEENLYDKYEDYRGWIKVDNTNIVRHIKLVNEIIRLINFATDDTGHISP